MKHTKYFVLILAFIFCTILSFSVPVFAAELTEAQVQEAVAEQGKETITGNLFIWFLCAIAFLKVSQKIDSFLSSIGINVGNTGGNMLGELMIAGRTVAGAIQGHGGGGFSKSSSPGNAVVQESFLSGGLSGAVGRQIERSAINAATGYSQSNSIGNSIYRSSLEKGGDFANNVISNIARGNFGQVGSIKGEDAQKAFSSYMGLNQNNSTNLASYSNMEIGGGRITGTENTDSGNREFAMYHADQYMTPKGAYETVTSVDGSKWYKQYAQDTVSKTPYDSGNGKIAYHETIVQQIPPAPSRKDRV